MKSYFLLPLLALAPLHAQNSDFNLTIVGGGTRLVMAVPDFRGAGGAEPLMAVFNQTLWTDLDECGLIALKPKTQYPLTIPQLPREVNVREWASPPLSANYLAIGYGALRDDLVVMYGALLDVHQANADAATVFTPHYQEPMKDGAAGARKMAHEFAADIIRRLGGTSLVGSKIYFISDRDGQSNVWVMDADGANQRQVTKLKSPNSRAAFSPAISVDGSKLAIMTYAEFFPKIYVYALDPLRRLPFANPDERLRTTPAFTPDGSHIVLCLAGQIYLADLDGGHPRSLSASAKDMDVEPKVNPKTGAEIAFVSGRSGHARLYRMTLDGTDVNAITPLDGEATNPSWHPSGQLLAYSCTKGNVPGSFHTCVIDVATQKISIEIPSGGDKDEYPVWAPDGTHLAFMRTRGDSEQIWTMLSDGTHQHQLTTEGHNKTPVWSVR